MHILIAVLYGFIVWLSLMLYALIVGGSVALPLFTAPFIVSGAALFIILLDLLVCLVMAVFTKIFKARAARRAASKGNYELESTTGAGNKSR